MSPRHPSAPSRFAVRFIRTYRENVRSRYRRHCRFEPTCSTYGLLAYERYGFWRATGKTLWRILRCNPLNRRADRYDPP